VQALKLRNSKCSIGTVISGKLSSFEQPLISNLQSLVRNWIDETFHLDKEVSTCVTDCGTSLLEVCSKCKRVIFCEIVGQLDL